MFTPTTKAESGHDLPLSRQKVEDILGKTIARELEDLSTTVYLYASRYARDRGIIIADTKFEFGFCDGKLILVDEILTPDSSRFWETKQYVIGQSQPSFDKQPVRDWLAASGWNKQPPAPALPQEIIDMTSRRYKAVYSKLVGKNLRTVI